MRIVNRTGYDNFTSDPGEGRLTANTEHLVTSAAFLNEFTTLRARFAIFLDELGGIYVFLLTFMWSIMRVSFDREAL
jgi:hypothetical protein